MKRLLKLVAGIFAGIGMVAVALLFWAQHSGLDHQERFFNAMGSGDPKQVYAMFHPALMDQVDEPVLIAWMRQLKSGLGAFNGLSSSNFSTSTKIENGNQVTESSGTVNFEKGTASSKLKYVGGQLVSFDVDSDIFKEEWFKGPGQTTIYQERGRSFLAHMFENRPEDAFKMMHVELQKEFPLAQTKEVAAQIMEKLSPLKGIQLLKESVNPAELYMVTDYFLVSTDKGDVNARVSFRFSGLKGHLSGFVIGEEAKPE